MSDLLFDTRFLIDLEREMRKKPGKAHAFLEQHAADIPWISWVIAGEFAEGFADIEDPACLAMLSSFNVVDMNKATAGHYAKTTSALRSKNQLIGTNDLWIATAARSAGLPLVTNNTAHFSRVPGLTILNY